MLCSWSSNVTSRRIKSHHHITSHHIMSNTDTRWYCSCYRYSDSNIIDLSARDTSRHHIISYHIISCRILIHADTAAATDTQTVISLTYQPEIPQDITSHHIKCYRNIELQSQSQCSYSTVRDKTIRDNTITGQSRAALLSTVRYYHRIDDTSRLVVLRVISVEL